MLRSADRVERHRTRMDYSRATNARPARLLGCHVGSAAFQLVLEVFAPDRRGDVRRTAVAFAAHSPDLFSHRSDTAARMGTGDFPAGLARHIAGPLSRTAAAKPAR